MAAAFTGGYRARFALPNATSDRDGIYVAVNYNYCMVSDTKTSIWRCVWIPIAPGR